MKPGRLAWKATNSMTKVALESDLPDHRTLGGSVALSGKQVVVGPDWLASLKPFTLARALLCEWQEAV